MKVGLPLLFSLIPLFPAFPLSGEETGPFSQVFLTTEDGWRLAALVSWKKGMNQRGVIFLHDKGRNGRDWYLTGLKAANSGFTTVIPDLRGHGRSSSRRGETVPFEKLGKKSLQAMISDLDLWVKLLAGKGVPLKNVTLIGASLGANIAFNYAAAHPDTGKCILLSPGLAREGMGIEDAIASYGERPLLIMFSRGDTYSVKTSLYMDSLLKGDVDLKILEGDARGTDLLKGNISAEADLILWLKSRKGEKREEIRDMRIKPRVEKK